MKPNSIETANYGFGCARSSEVPSDRFTVARFALFASAIAGRSMQVAAVEPGQLAWTDGKVIYVDTTIPSHEQLASLAVQASLLASGGLALDVITELRRSPSLSRRYLALEGRRALTALGPLLPDLLAMLVAPNGAAPCTSPWMSLAVARSPNPVAAPPPSFGALHVRVLAAKRAEHEQADNGRTAHSNKHSMRRQLDLDTRTSETGHEDIFPSQLSGGGTLGRWFAKMLAALRQAGRGGVAGADAPTHLAESAPGGTLRTVSSTACDRAVTRARLDQRDASTTYPEWDDAKCQHRLDWCTVREAEAVQKPGASSIVVPQRASLRHALSRLGLSITRHRRQMDGDDIDVDAAIEARVEALAGSPQEGPLYIANVRRRRDLSVLLLLDVSGSAAEPDSGAQTIHEQQRAAAAALLLVLHELGARVALYAYNSQGRTSVNLWRVKRFGEGSCSLAIRRLASLEARAYSRLGAAIRHGTAVVQREGGAAYRLLVVISDGLAYDHGYEPSYGAADARRALAEARAGGVGCLCLSVGANTTASLAHVFGESAHAAVAVPEQLHRVIGPLFRSALRSADVRRHST